MKLFYILPLALLSASAFASQNSTLSLNIDNDGVFGVDRDYTNGLFLTYTSGSITPYWWAKPLSLSAWGASSLDKWAISIANKMWTPSDITLEKPEPNERPYAGFLYAEFNYISLHPQQASRFNLTLGTTGESSLSEKAQKIVHGITKSDDPNGWVYQVEDQVAGSVGYLSHFKLARYRSYFGTELEFSNVSEANIGNFRSDVSTGFMMRWGADLANNFGSAQIDAENPFYSGMIGTSNSGWFLFAGLEGRYRFNDVTIEGDRPLNGLEYDPQYYQVNVEHVQATAVAGAAWYIKHFGASLSFTANTSEYEEDKNSIHGVGSLSFFAFF
ncbi:DUF2219 family protein [Vibrio aestuarianus]|uniref:lipid A deacylase LpxR family protein n=1 Tax=Vibrio aestuarianus TaxID=28171 RepID=UPI00237C8C9F|nr:lipid A-modifier LpxR family protein [Vibrio aestuarianus]MDE1314343.1 DUF2219 family protein [Vibrio aestuarianus]